MKCPGCKHEITEVVVETVTRQGGKVDERGEVYEVGDIYGQEEIHRCPECEEELDLKRKEGV